MSTAPRILLVDDDEAVLRGIGGFLRDEGYRVATARNVAGAEAALASAEPPALLVLDLRMPGEDGLAFLARLPRPLPVPIVVLSGEASPSDAALALKRGATDFVEKPPAPERLLTAVRNALALAALADETARLREALSAPEHLVGASAAIEALRAVVARVAPSDAVVLVAGETGTGKERVARALHAASRRRGRFVAVNCAAIPAELLESELFGHERGAFSGAAARRIGRFEQADKGTLLLDEVGDMPIALQAKILRALEQREIERLGGTGPVAVDTRVVAATHRDLRQLVREGRFREDLYYRLAVFPVAVPALRERPDDIVPLVRAFAAEALGTGAEALVVAPDGEAALRRHAWPGNVRELRNFVLRLSLLRPERPLVVDAAAVAEATEWQPRKEAGGPTPFATLGTESYRELVEGFERALLRAALARTGGNVAEAARLLMMDRGNLHRRIKALSVEADQAP